MFNFSLLSGALIMKHGRSWEMPPVKKKNPTILLFYM